MVNYIKRELKNACKRKMTFVFVICVVGICFLANFAVMAFSLIYGSEIDGVLGSNVLAFASWSFPVAYLACIVIADIIFGKEYPNYHIKDNVTRGLSRTKIYLGKLIASLIISIAFMIIAFIMLMISTCIFHSDIVGYDIIMFLQNLALAVPLFVAGVSFGIMYLFMFPDKKWAYVAYFLTTLVVPRLIMYLAAEPLSLPPFILIRKILISQSFGHIPYLADPDRSVPFIVVQGFVYAILSCVIGIVVYNKKDAKRD